MAPGDSRYDPDEEEFILQEESLHHTSGSRFTRVLSNFVFFEGGRPADMDSCMSLARPSPNLEVVGIAATISGREGLFAQCGWFGDTDVEWIWTRLSKFLSLEVRQDIRFRGGHPCVWLATKLGDYALVLPHTIYIDQWEQSLSLMQPTGLTAKLGMWPTGGTRPFWWEDRWKEDWPFDKATRSKRRASKDLEEVSPYGVETDSRLAAPKWRRLGTNGDTRHPGQPKSHLHHLTPWPLARDAGLLLTTPRLPPSLKPPAE